MHPLALPENASASRCSFAADKKILRALKGTSHRLAFIATGSYGRQALTPFTDIDLLILHAAPLSAAEEALIGNLLHSLWDSNLTTGHAVRTVEETLALATKDHATFCSLLDSRLIAGDSALYKTFVQKVAALLAREKETFLRDKLTEFRQRHEKMNGKAPNLLLSPGGLRDMQTLTWVARALGADDALPTSLQQHHEYLWGLRYRQHEAARWKEDDVSENKNAITEAMAVAEKKIAKALELLLVAETVEGHHVIAVA